MPAIMLGREKQTQNVQRPVQSCASTFSLYVWPASGLPPPLCTPKKKTCARQGFTSIKPSHKDPVGQVSHKHDHRKIYQSPQDPTSITQRWHFHLDCDCGSDDCQQHSTQRPPDERLPGQRTTWCSVGVPQLMPSQGLDKTNTCV